MTSNNHESHESVRRQLQLRRDVLMARIERIDDRFRSAGEKRYSSAGEFASDHFNDEVLDGIANQERAELESISHALKRMDDGTYGVCAACEDPIPEKRLQALPFATRCVPCEAAQTA